MAPSSPGPARRRGGRKVRPSQELGPTAGSVGSRRPFTATRPLHTTAHAGGPSILVGVVDPESDPLRSRASDPSLLTFPTGGLRSCVPPAPRPRPGPGGARRGPERQVGERRDPSLFPSPLPARAEVGVGVGVAPSRRRRRPPFGLRGGARLFGQTGQAASPPFSRRRLLPTCLRPAPFRPLGDRSALSASTAAVDLCEGARGPVGGTRYVAIAPPVPTPARPPPSPVHASLARLAARGPPTGSAPGRLRSIRPHAAAPGGLEGFGEPGRHRTSKGPARAA